MLNLVSRRYWYFLASTLVIIPGIIFLALFGFNLGIDFKSGTTMTLVFSQPTSQAELRQFLASEEHEETIIQGTHKPGFVVKTQGSPDEQAIRQVLEDEFSAQGVFLSTAKMSEGTVLTIIFAHPVEQAKLLEVLEPQGVGLTQVKPTEKEAFLIRSRTIGQDPIKDKQGNIVAPSEKERLTEAMKKRFGPFGIFDFASVSPIIATEIGRNAAIAVAAAAVGILLYLAWAFRNMPQPFRYGTCAIIALVHDALVVLGIFAILGKLANVEIDALFVTGILAVIGYSVNDTVVAFDRIRENISKGISPDFETTVNFSLVQTLARSLNTSLTTIFAVLAIFLLGGVTIRDFSLVLLIGIISGTYSSIFIASQLLIVWEKREWRRFLPCIPSPSRAGG